MAGALRIESLHALEVQRDTGSIVALGQALALLQTGTPSGSPPYSYYTTIGTPPASQNFSVTFTPEDGTTWTVQVTPIPPGGELPSLQLPASFSPFDVVP